MKLGRFIRYLRVFLLLFGVVSLLAGMHNVDIAMNMRLINAYSDMRLRASDCVVEFPMLWEYDGFPNGAMMNSRDIYLFGVQLEMIGVAFLLVAFVMLVK